MDTEAANGNCTPFRPEATHRKRQANTQAETTTLRQTSIQTERQRDKKTERQKDKETERQRDKKTKCVAQVSDGYDDDDDDGDLKKKLVCQCALTVI